MAEAAERLSREYHLARFLSLIAECGEIAFDIRQMLPRTAPNASRRWRIGERQNPLLAVRIWIWEPEHTSPSVISVAAPSFRLVPGVIAAIHRSGAGFPETGDEALRVRLWHLADI